MYKDDGFTKEDSDMLANSEPVVLVGRGGSGTRLLSQLALSLGVFLGNKLNESLDSEEWVEDIYRLAISATSAQGIESGAAPERFWIRQIRKRAKAILRAAHKSHTEIWGWKLPETILALPQILKAFPNAYVIHLVRHPLTSSWRRTHMTSRTDNPIGRAVLAAAYKACGFDPENIDRDEPYIHNVLTWTYQVQQAYDVLNSMVRPGRMLYLRYEDICDSASAVRDRMSGFLGLGTAGTTCPVEIHPERITAMPEHTPETAQAWSISGEVATRLGYEYNPLPAKAKHGTGRQQ